ncbi:MAG: hypothetical protein IIX95_05505, partial [Clostridiales bacterium]|nr:hypothetical protein [Clostridiales bacterium]
NGYADGVADIQELDNEGVEYARKNTENAGNSANDWEFQNLTEEQYKMIRGQILDYAYFVTAEGDTLTISFSCHKNNWENMDLSNDWSHKSVDNIEIVA